MGWDRRTITIDFRTSSHGSEQDIKDQADAAELLYRVRMIAAEHRYAALRPEVWGTE